MKFTERLKRDRKFLLVVIGIILAALILPYLTLPALALWWFYKTPKLSKNLKRITIGIIGGTLIIGMIGGFIAYANDPEPHLTILEPTTALTTTETKDIVIRGTYDPVDRKVWVNGNKINASNGNFETTYRLKEGENKIEVSAGEWKRAKTLLTVNRELSDIEKQARITPTVTSAPQNIKQAETSEQKIENKIRASLKERTNNDQDKFVEIRVNKSFTDESAGKYVVLVTLNADDNLTNDLTKKGIWIDMSNIYITLYKDSNNIAQATIIAHALGVDKYGKENDQVVLKTMLSQDEAKKVNWNADKSMLELSILPDVWDTQINRF